MERDAGSTDGLLTLIGKRLTPSGEITVLRSGLRACFSVVSEPASSLSGEGAVPDMTREWRCGLIAVAGAEGGGDGEESEGEGGMFSWSRVLSSTEFEEVIVVLVVVVVVEELSLPLSLPPLVVVSVREWTTSQCSKKPRLVASSVRVVAVFSLDSFVGDNGVIVRELQKKLEEVSFGLQVLEARKLR